MTSNGEKVVSIRLEQKLFCFHENRISMKTLILCQCNRLSYFEILALKLSRFI